MYLVAIVHWATLRPILECSVESCCGPVAARRRLFASCRRFMLKLLKAARKSQAPSPSERGLSVSAWLIERDNETTPISPYPPARAVSLFCHERRSHGSDVEARRSLFMEHLKSRLGRFCAATYRTLAEETVRLKYPDGNAVLNARLFLQRCEMGCRCLVRRNG